MVESPSFERVAEQALSREQAAAQVHDIEARIRRFVWIAVSSLLLAAFGLGLTVIFIPAGIFLALVAVFIGVVGLVGSFVVPRFIVFWR